MSWVAVAIIGSAVIGVGYSIYLNENQPDAPQMPAPQKPASYYNEGYDENGDWIVTEQVWDEGRNAYVTRYDPEPTAPTKPTPAPTDVGPAPNRKDPKYWGGVGWPGDKEGYYNSTGLSQYNKDSAAWQAAQSGANAAANTQADADYQPTYAAWQEKHDAWLARKEERKAAAAEFKKEKALRQEIRMKILGELDQTPEDRLAAYGEYAKTLSDAMHTDVDKRFEETKRASEESMSQRGMTGSRASVDIEAELVGEKEKADVDIAQRATLAKSTLEQADRDFNLRTLANLDAGQSSENTLAYQKQRDIGLTGLQATGAANASLASSYGTDVGSRFEKYKYDLYANQAAADRYMDTSRGLAYLYGYNKGTIRTGTMNSGYSNPNYGFA